MRYKIEVIYISGWDDACWTEYRHGVTRRLRFQTVASAQRAIDKFFDDVKDAAAVGNVDTEENPNHDRIVAVNE